MLAAEVGFGTVKVKTSQGCFLFPSAVAEERGEMDFGKHIPGVYQYEGKSLLVGNGALSRANLIYVPTADWLLKYTPLFCFHAITKARCEHEDTIVVGLPPEYFIDYHDQLKQTLYSFSINDREHGFKRVMVMPQGVGSFADYCSKNPPAENEASLLVDVGSNTLNMMLANGEMVNPKESIQLSRSGACIPAKQVMAFLRRQDITISQIQAHQILKSGKYEGESIPILPEILKNFAERILDEVFSNYANHGLSRIIFSGGGAALIYNHLPKNHRFSSKFCFIDNPEFSNVRGYYLAGLSHLVVEHNL